MRFSEVGDRWIRRGDKLDVFNELVSHSRVFSTNRAKRDWAATGISNGTCGTRNHRTVYDRQAWLESLYVRERYAHEIGGFLERYADMHYRDRISNVAVLEVMTQYWLRTIQDLGQRSTDFTNS